MRTDGEQFNPTQWRWILGYTTSWRSLANGYIEHTMIHQLFVVCSWRSAAEGVRWHNKIVRESTATYQNKTTLSTIDDPMLLYGNVNIEWICVYLQMKGQVEIVRHDIIDKANRNRQEQKAKNFPIILNLVSKVPAVPSQWMNELGGQRTNERLPLLNHNLLSLQSTRSINQNSIKETNHVLSFDIPRWRNIFIACFTWRTHKHWYADGPH